MPDTFTLERFVGAQDYVIDAVLAELRQGHKETHWMWFVFPQLRIFGTSAMSKIYGIRSWQEAKAYLAHPILGPRLIACTQLVNSVTGRRIEEIFHDIDVTKFWSCMTLFAHVAGDGSVFHVALERYFYYPDQATIDFLNSSVKPIDNACGMV
jgi:uncharacterized protein (DUF1810 family)